MSAKAIAARNLRGNSSTLGALWIAYAILRLAAAILLVLSGTATVMFGALLTRVADFVTLMAIFHVLHIVILVAALSGIFGLLAGSALLAGKSSARTLSLVTAFLSLFNLPLGTTLGIYS